MGAFHQLLLLELPFALLEFVGLLSMLLELPSRSATLELLELLLTAPEMDFDLEDIASALTWLRVND